MSKKGVKRHHKEETDRVNRLAMRLGGLVAVLLFAAMVISFVF